MFTDKQYAEYTRNEKLFNILHDEFYSHFREALLYNSTTKEFYPHFILSEALASTLEAVEKRYGYRKDLRNLVRLFPYFNSNKVFYRFLIKKPYDGEQAGRYDSLMESVK